MSALPATSFPSDEVELAWGMPYADFLFEGGRLILAHWNEVGAHRDVLKLNPDHLRYQAAERAGMLHILTARIDGHLVGYFFLMVLGHPRDRGAKLGTDELMYVVPEFRRYRVGPKMIAAAEAKCVELGVDIVMFRRKVERKNAGKDLERRGYHAVEIVYAKVLKQPHQVAPETEAEG